MDVEEWAYCPQPNWWRFSIDLGGEDGDIPSGGIILAEDMPEELIPDVEVWSL